MKRLTALALALVMLLLCLSGCADTQQNGDRLQDKLHPKQVPETQEPTQTDLPDTTKTSTTEKTPSKGNTAQRPGEPEVSEEATADLSPIPLPQILGDHNARHRADGADHHGEHGGKFPRKANACHTDAAQLADHDLVYDAEGRLQHGLQRHRHGQRAHRLKKALFLFHGGPLPVCCSCIVPPGGAFFKG